MQSSSEQQRIETAEVPLDRDIFLRTLIRELAGTLEEVVGLDEAKGYISIVGRAIGEQINQEYKKALSLPNLTRPQVAAVMVDLKRRIQGEFYIIEESGDQIVLGNRTCPFGEKVLGRTSMCMMTANVLGSIAAENLGYAKVEIQEAIARGHAGCRLVVYLKKKPESDAQDGQEFYRGQFQL